MEKVDEHTLFITEIAAYLHDIGVKISKEKYGNSQPQHQEAEGPIIAKDMLSKYDLPAEDVDASINLASHFIDEPKKKQCFFLNGSSILGMHLFYNRPSPHIQSN